MITYVLGFAFDDLNRVALIRKNKPDWQRGRWNGIGGKVEESDIDMFDAMEREFREETGVTISIRDWVLAGEMVGADRDWKVFVLTCKHRDVRLCRTIEEEPVALWMVTAIDSLTTIENVPALIALCQIPAAAPSMRRPSFVLNY